MGLKPILRPNKNRTKIYWGHSFTLHLNISKQKHYPETTV